MLLEALLALTTVLPRLDSGIAAARARLDAFALPAPPPFLRGGPPAPPVFSAAARAVSNWRDEAGASLRPASLALVAKYSGTDPAFVARCVKLNNYWCIKQARWSGELGGDAEGHTGFATAADGADAAALLLRRYYRDYGRRSALAIVRRWAPAECGLPRTAAAGPRRPSVAAPRISAEIAPRGLGGTLRARFLAGHGRGGAVRPRQTATDPQPKAAEARGPLPGQTAAPARRDAALRVQPWSARARLAGHPGRAARGGVPMPRAVADIAAGIGLPDSDRKDSGRKDSGLKPEVARTVPTVDTKPGPRMPPTGRAALLPTAARAAAAAPRGGLGSGAADPARLLASDRLVAESASLPSILASLPGGRLLDLSVPAPLCANDEARIRNYAQRIAGSLGLRPDDDLGLFAADGTATARLATVMLAMSSVELGSLRATPALVAAAVERLGRRFPGAATATATEAALRLGRN